MHCGCEKSLELKNGNEEKFRAHRSGCRISFFFRAYDENKPGLLRWLVYLRVFVGYYRFMLLPMAYQRRFVRHYLGNLIYWFREMKNSREEVDVTPQPLPNPISAASLAPPLCEFSILVVCG
jgi:hypothetical protein